MGKERIKLTQKDRRLLNHHPAMDKKFYDELWKQILESQRIVEVLERDFPNTYEDIKHRIK